MANEPLIIHDDDALLIVAKPAGMVVNRADTTENGSTLQDWVETDYGLKISGYSGELGKVFELRSGIAHRLDKETSGVMVIGKTPFIHHKR